jgi:hypothetical protein
MLVGFYLEGNCGSSMEAVQGRTVRTMQCGSLALCLTTVSDKDREPEVNFDTE